jgi:hypothetical protein
VQGNINITLRHYNRIVDIRNLGISVSNFRKHCLIPAASFRESHLFVVKYLRPLPQCASQELWHWRCDSLVSSFASTLRTRIFPCLGALPVHWICSDILLKENEKTLQCIVFWVIPRCLSFKGRRFGTKCQFHLQRCDVWMMPSQAKPSQAKVLTGGGDVPLSGSHTCVWPHCWAR